MITPTEYTVPSGVPEAVLPQVKFPPPPPELVQVIWSSPLKQGLQPQHPSLGCSQHLWGRGSLVEMFKECSKQPGYHDDSPVGCQEWGW